MPTTAATKMPQTAIHWSAGGQIQSLEPRLFMIWSNGGMIQGAATAAAPGLNLHERYAGFYNRSIAQRGGWWLQRKLGCRSARDVQVHLFVFEISFTSVSRIWLSTALHMS